MHEVRRQRVHGHQFAGWVLGWKRSPLLEACSEQRDGMLVTSVSMLVM